MGIVRWDDGSGGRAWAGGWGDQGGINGVNGDEWVKMGMGSRWEIWEGAVNNVEGVVNRVATTLQRRCFP
jgi:hypothetical protein